MERFVVCGDSQRRKQVLAEVPDEYKEIVAISAAILADSTSYACPFCERRMPLGEERPHKKECDKRPLGI
jgi:hypothetical protein